MPKLRFVWEKLEEDPDIGYPGDHVDEGTARKTLMEYAKPRQRVIIAYKRDYWERMRLVYALAKLLVEAGIKTSSIFSDVLLDHTVKIFNASTATTNIMPRIRPSEDWTIVNIKTGEKGAEHIDIDSAPRKIYSEHHQKLTAILQENPMHNQIHGNNLTKTNRFRRDFSIITAKPQD